MKNKLSVQKGYPLIAMLLLLFVFTNTHVMAADITGKVQSADNPIAGARVTLYAAGERAPKQLAQGKTGSDGSFKLQVEQESKEKVLYLIAKGGAPRGSGPNNAIVLMALLGTELPKTVTVNELTTVASVWTAAQFLRGEVLIGNKLGLQIAARNVPNLVNLETGGFGASIQDSLNSNYTPILARFCTLGNLLSGCINRVQDDAVSKFFALTTLDGGSAPTDTLTACQNIARQSWRNADKLFGLFQELFPLKKETLFRSAPFLPYLSQAPTDWSLALRFSGGGLCAPGKIAIDSEGNIWTGNNWMPGSQATLAGESLGGHLSKFTSDGKALSPAISGFTGGGIYGVGFGTMATEEGTVWTTSFAGKVVSTFDRNGKATSPPEGYNFGEKLKNLQSIIVARNGDVWFLDCTGNKIGHLLKGDPKQAKFYTPNLEIPFHLGIDQESRIWVTNAKKATVTRFPASDPSKAEEFKVGHSPKGLAIDSKGNVWVANALGDLQPQISEVNGKKPSFLEFLNEEWQVSLKAQTGSISLLRPDGTNAPESPFTGGGKIVGPWGLAIDGDDHVWVANFGSKTVTQLAGVQTDKTPQGLKTGDEIVTYDAGGIQHITDIAIDQAGNVWVANNWDESALAFESPVPDAISTRTAGNGLVVIYGVAKPVRTPLVGPPRQP